MTTNDHRIDETRPDDRGIKLVEADIFRWGEYRSANLRDAIAAAKRGDRR